MTVLIFPFCWLLAGIHMPASIYPLSISDDSLLAYISLQNSFSLPAYAASAPVPCSAATSPCLHMQAGRDGGIGDGNKERKQECIHR